MRHPAVGHRQHDETVGARYDDSVAVADRLKHGGGLGKHRPSDDNRGAGRGGSRQIVDYIDLRFGKIYFLGQLRRWDAFARVIGRTIDYSVQIGHRWCYPNVPDDMMEELLVEGMVDYMVEMFVNIADTAHLTAADTLMARRIQGVAKRIVQLFPGDFPSTYMLALSHLMLSESDKAYKYLMRAEGLDSTSVPLIKSLIKVCRLLGTNAQAKEYQQRLSTLSE